MRAHVSSTLVALALLLHGLTVSRASAQCSVDLALVLAIDTSSSIDAEEHQLQIAATARALTSQATLDAVLRGPHGQIAVNYVFWGDPEFATQQGTWRLVGNAGDLTNFAYEMVTMSRRIMGDTGVASAISSSIDLIKQLPCSANRKVIDVSGDGRENTLLAKRKRTKQDATMREMSARATADGITINGLALLSNDLGLHDWYRKHVQLGADSFVLIAQDWSDFEAAMRKKLVREISSPLVSERFEPASRSAVAYIRPPADSWRK